MQPDSRQPIRTLYSGSLELDVLLSGGPRIVGLRYRNSQNLLAEVPEIAVPTPYGEFHYIGGHRLWYAPEAMPRSYMPDSEGLISTVLSDGILLQGNKEPDTGISKSLEIHLRPDLPQVTLVHHLENRGLWEVDLAPWAITMFPLGGVAIMPYQAENVDRAGLLPDRHVTFWPYTSIHDPRIWLENDFVFIYANANLPSCKIGTFNPRGWLAYWNNGILFEKRFVPIANVQYPDKGCNSEIYCDEHFIELESLSPMVQLAPGNTVTYQEDWFLYSDLEQDFLPGKVLDRLPPFMQ